MLSINIGWGAGVILGKGRRKKVPFFVDSPLRGRGGKVRVVAVPLTTKPRGKGLKALVDCPLIQ